MISRPYWQKHIKDAWAHRSIIWLSGIRRAGKTHLCQALPDIEYFDCELPRVRHLLEDPESFFSQKHGKYLVLDEIHRLENPSEILKIGADHYSSTKIIATGSSILGASSKFKDTLTGRKTELWLTPMLLDESNYFGNTDIKHRLLFGGLPPFFMSKDLPEKDFQEWLDAYWAKDIQELFRLERRYSFLKFTELLLAQSGAIFEATRFAKLCEVSRTTIANYLSVLEATYVMTVVRPFSQHRATEIVSAPKVYGFDTGFICHCKGWINLRKEDLGTLWEHLVLNEIQGRLQLRQLQYWRDKRGHEIDFIFLKRHKQHPIAIECKWSAKEFDADNLKIFRGLYPEGKNYVVAQDVSQSYLKKYNDIDVLFVSLQDLIAALQRDG